MSKQNQVVINFRDSTENSSRVDELVTREIFSSKSDFYRTASEKLLLENIPSVNAKTVTARVPNAIFHWLNRNIIGPGEYRTFENLIVELLRQYRDETRNEMKRAAEHRGELEREYAEVRIRKNEIQSELDLL